MNLKYNLIININSPRILSILEDDQGDHRVLLNEIAISPLKTLLAVSKHNKL